MEPTASQSPPSETKVWTFRNIAVALMLALVAGRLALGWLGESADRRIADDPDTYGTGVIPTPETLIIFALWLGMAIMGVAAVVFLMLWANEGRKSRREILE